MRYAAHTRTYIPRQTLASSFSAGTQHSIISVGITDHLGSPPSSTSMSVRIALELDACWFCPFRGTECACLQTLSLRPTSSKDLI